MNAASRRLSHPILRLEVIGPDGVRRDAQRVFCRYRNRSVPVSTCTGCIHCDAITTTNGGSVECTVPARSSDDTQDADGETTRVGALLHGAAVAIEPEASLRDALAMLGTGERLSLPVVDAHNVLVGVVYPRPALVQKKVSQVMSRPLAVHESTPVRRALRLMAATHAREATVVDDDGVPIGTFHDVDGLRWIGERRPRAQKAASSATSPVTPT